MSAGLSPIAGAALGALEAELTSAAAAAAAPGFYERLRDGTAKNLVEKFKTGAVVLIKPNQAQGSDPLNAFDGVPVRTPRNAIVTGFPTDAIDETRILSSDRKVLIDAADFTNANEPDGADLIEIDGRRHNIVLLKAVPAAGPAVIYIMQARTGGRG